MQSGEYACYPYDINYIWMKGFSSRNSDELKREDFKEVNGQFIRQYLGRLLRKNPKLRILEKTVSNGLRLDYVLEVIPEAQIIHLVRDGRDVTASIKSCWEEPAFSEKNQSRRLQLDKLRNFPITTAGPYLLKYLINNLPKLFGKTAVQSWGPRFDGMSEMQSDKSLVEICANQWARSVKHFRSREKDWKAELSSEEQDLALVVLEEQLKKFKYL